jgi:hypothetical protein
MPEQNYTDRIISPEPDRIIQPGADEAGLSHQRKPKGIRIGKSTLVFRSTTSKKLAMHGSITQLLFLALEELDLDKLTRVEMDRIIALLQQEDPQKLKHDLKLAPARINDFVVRHFLRKP